jgi:hypothetical protein
MRPRVLFLSPQPKPSDQGREEQRRQNIEAVKNVSDCSQSESNAMTTPPSGRNSISLGRFSPLEALVIENFPALGQYLPFRDIAWRLAYLAVSKTGLYPWRMDPH